MTLCPLGIIAGSGDLPVRLAERCRDMGRPYVVGRIDGMVDDALRAHPGADVGIGEIGKMIRLFRQNAVQSVCFAGVVKRPDFQHLKVDAAGLALLPRVLAAARQGDDALLRTVMGAFERAGFTIEGAEAAHGALTRPLGPLGRIDLDAHKADAHKAMKVARLMGQHDIGQGAVICDGLVLAVEAQEGTDGLLARVATLPAPLRGDASARRGVLAKAPKPIQDRRIDLPTIGVRTINDVAHAGLAGIVAEAGATLLLDADAIQDAADRLGLFVVGLPPLGDGV